MANPPLCIRLLHLVQPLPVHFADQLAARPAPAESAENHVNRTTRLQLDCNQFPAVRLEVENRSRHEPELPAKGFRDGDLATFRNFCLHPAHLV